MEDDNVNYLKNILALQGCDGVITDYGFDLLSQENIVTNHNQAKVLARLIKEIASNNYNAGYSDGRAEQAYTDGKKVADLLKGGNQ